MFDLGVYILFAVIALIILIAGLFLRSMSKKNQMEKQKRIRNRKSPLESHKESVKDFFGICFKYFRQYPCS